jgi:predicted flap endonuclease-1-like 5' DNA nuclease
MDKRNIILGILGGLISFLLTLLFLYIFLPRKRRQLPADMRTAMEDEAGEKRIIIEEAESVEPDDLTAINGIGLVISEALTNAGVTTYAQLAAMDSGDIQLILDRAGVRAVVSETWIEQAGAAAGIS